jgi:nucleoside-diphosphate-sugar epimerase
MDEKLNILITGGAGFIGGYFYYALRNLGHFIRIVDVEKRNEINSGSDYIIQDVLNRDKLISAMDSIDLVIHLAAKHRFFGISKREFFRVNEEGTTNVLWAMDAKGVKKVIFFSTVAVYGETNGPSDECTEPNPNTPYGLSKLAAENWIKKWASDSVDKTAIILRPAVIFGPRNKGNVYRLIRQIYHRAYIPVGQGNNIKSIACVDNVVKATLFLMSMDLKGVNIFNYADSPHLSYREIVDIIYSGLGRKLPGYYLPLTPMIKISNCLDKILNGAGAKFSLTTTIKKMNKQTYHKAEKIVNLGFSPSCSSIDGLERMVEWYLEDKNRNKRTCRNGE